MSEIRPLLLRCAVCGTEMGNVEVDVTLPDPVLMPAHAYQPGYKCFGSGVEAVKLGRGEVIDPPAEAP